jgi:hypothetical protein
MVCGKWTDGSCVTDSPWKLIRWFMLAGALLEFLLANTDSLSLTHGRSAVADGRSMSPSRTIYHRLADWSKSFAPWVVLPLWFELGHVHWIDRSVVTTWPWHWQVCAKFLVVILLLSRVHSEKMLSALIHSPFLSPNWSFNWVHIPDPGTYPLVINPRVDETVGQQPQ